MSQWAELRHQHFVEEVSKKELADGQGPELVAVGYSGRVIVASRR